MNQLNDEVIINQVINGHSSSYGLLVERYKSYVFSIALNIVQDRTEAEEVAQDTFIKAYKNLNKFNRESKFSTWLYRITFNTSLTAKKKLSKRRFEHLDAGFDPILDQTDKTEVDDRKKYISLIMSKINEKDALVLTLFYLKELSLEEICDITNLTLSNLKVRLHRARKRFSIELDKVLKEEALSL